MAEMSDEMLADMAQVIVEAVKPERVIVFGSWARGEPAPDSDVDLLVVESQPFDQGRSRRKEMVRLWQALADFAVPKDILVYSSDEVERWRGSLNHVVGRALREGRELYGPTG